MRGSLVAALGFILTLQGASAAEAVFPPASRVGIVPLDDMVLSEAFQRFREFREGDRHHNLGNARRGL